MEYFIEVQTNCLLNTTVYLCYRLLTATVITVVSANAVCIACCRAAMVAASSAAVGSSISKTGDLNINQEAKLHRQ